jgi:hypothetical protein
LKLEFFPLHRNGNSKLFYWIKHSSESLRKISFRKNITVFRIPHIICILLNAYVLKYRGRQCTSYSMPWRALQGITFLGFFHSHLLFYFLSFSVHINKSSLVMGDVIWCRSPPQSELHVSKRGPNLSEIARICYEGI